MVIKSNLSSINTNRVMKFQSEKVDTGFRNLSSGKRINRAADDVTGMAVSAKMTSQILGLDRAEKNAMDGISLIQTAEGYLHQTIDLMNRIRQLAVQGANGIYTDEDRLYIQVEVSQLVAEVDRIGFYASFNEMAILTGRFANEEAGGIPSNSMWFHVGANANQRFRAFISTMTAYALNLKDVNDNLTISISAPAKANDTLEVVDNSLKKIFKQLADLGAYQSRLGFVTRSLAIGNENLKAARSRIRDANMAEEVTDLTTNRILSESQIAVLAQSNQRPQGVLRLLQ